MNGWDANVFDRRIFRLLKNQVHSVASNFIFAFFEFLLKLQIMRFALGWNEPIQLHFHKFNMKWKRCVHFFALMWPIFQIEIFNEICVNLLWLILSNKLNSELNTDAKIFRLSNQWNHQLWSKKYCLFYWIILSRTL